MENSEHVVGDEIIVSGNATDNIEVEKLDLVIDFDYNNTLDITSYLEDDVFSYGIYSDGWSIGDHTLLVTAQDTSGNTRFILRTIKIIELVPPVVLIEYPEDDNILKLGELIAISGIANDNEDVVDLQLKINDEPSIDITTELQPDGSWSYSWDTQSYSDDIHTIEVMATDSSGNTHSHVIEVILDGTPPELSLLNPPENSRYKLGETIIIEGTASDNWAIYMVILDFNGELTLDITNLLSDGHWYFEFDSDDLGEGEHVISYLVADMGLHGHMIQRNIRIQEAVKPEVQISSPRNNYIAKRGNTVEITGTAYDNKDIQSLNIKFDDNTPIDITENLREDGFWSYEWNTRGFSPYEHRIEVIAQDSAENSASDSISIILDGDTPEISIWLTSDEEVYSAGSFIEFQGTASDDWKLSKLTLEVDDGAKVDITNKVLDGKWEYTFTNTHGLSSGENTFTLTAVDSVGHERKATIEVIIDSEFPEVGITEIEEDITPGDTVTISGFANDDVEIKQIILYIDDEDPIIVTPTFSSGRWQYDLDTTHMTKGRHTISVTVSDSVDNLAYYDIRIKLVEEYTPQEENEEPVEKEEKDKIGPFEIEMFLLILMMAFVLIIAISAIAVSRGKKK
jgi:hypothetical protein